MAQDDTPEDLMHYEAMAQDALRGVVRSALKRAASPDGLPGAHHFYITFKTDAPGVSAPPDLLAKYPEEMTIVLQHQYRDLAPGETFFTVTLKFGGQPKRLSVPYAAVTRFYDPSVQFLLQFEPAAEAEDEAPPVAVKPPAAAPSGGEDAGPPAADGEEPKVVSLDQFRKK
ncbi:MAG TPA: ClpXP protease specificity-enhancing factor SspB [Caulobacteraceae bacterium]|nr:ClpXP protease specificity-enhancing factor SspB [Caulobacteraceae bacterium]